MLLLPEAEPDQNSSMHSSYFAEPVHGMGLGPNPAVNQSNNCRLVVRIRQVWTRFSRGTVRTGPGSGMSEPDRRTPSLITTYTHGWLRTHPRYCVVLEYDLEASAP